MFYLNKTNVNLKIDKIEIRFDLNFLLIMIYLISVKLV